MNSGLFTSDKDDWETPQVLFDHLDEEFDFELDPCCSYENKKCPVYFTKEHDGLSQSWSGLRVFMNPPYGREVKKWIKKAHEEAQKGSTVVCLVPARTDTAWFQDYCLDPKYEIRWVRGV